MSDSKTTNKFSLIDFPEIPESIDNAAKNLTDHPTKNIGQTLGDIWFLVFGGVSQIAKKRRLKYANDLESFKRELLSQVDKIPADKRQDPSIQVTALALENSKYCVEEPELRKMFSALISNSMNKDYSQDIHPSFAEIIKQMSSLDARIISLYKDKNGVKLGFPICQYVMNLPGSNASTSLPEHVFLELPDEKNIFRCSTSLSSLARFGILSLSYTQKLTGPAAYDKFLQHPIYVGAKQVKDFMNISIKRGVAIPTPLGRSFIKVCVPD